MRLLLVQPPLTQLNTPYPGTAYLARALRERGIPASQRDLGIELALSLFSREGLEEVFAELEEQDALPDPAWRALALAPAHLAAIDPVIAFLQGRDQSLAHRILHSPLLPTGPRLERADLEGFGPLGATDAARHLATLYLADLADLITSCVDPGFGLARYQHHLALSPAPFDPLWERLQEQSLVDRHLDDLIDTLDADVVGLSVPFPGNLYGALRIGRALKQRGVTVWMGGGYVNTELREVDEPRLWECVDALTYDDGEGPLLALIEHHQGGPDRRHRTRTAQGMHEATVSALPMTSAAWYGNLDRSLYLDLLDTLNPAHRLWSEGRWNKLTLAHGCYWKRCAFCDVSLDYISRYEPARIETLLDQIEELVQTTGVRGFHLVDEAAPPRGLRDLALGLLERDLRITFWGNIRFEEAFTPDLCRLLSAAGMVAVTGGLEVASDRLLERMAKGVTVEQVARAAQAFQEAGILVHAYLMYGFPTQSVQETVDSMELVRQLFEQGLLDSAFWHRFALTRHSPVYADPAAYGVVVPEYRPGFGAGDVPHTDPQGADHDQFDAVLPVALEAWMRGRELSRPVQQWFPTRMPPTTESPTRIAEALRQAAPRGRRLVWLGGGVWEEGEAVIVHSNQGTQSLFLPEPDQREWLLDVLEAATPTVGQLTVKQALSGLDAADEVGLGLLESLCEMGLVRV